jgi:hypothetical protein
LYDNQWHLIKSFDGQLTLPKMMGGANSIQFKAETNGNGTGDVKIELRAFGEKEMINLK